MKIQTHDVESFFAVNIFYFLFEPLTFNFYLNPRFLIRCLSKDFDISWIWVMSISGRLRWLEKWLPDNLNVVNIGEKMQENIFKTKATFSNLVEFKCHVYKYDKFM